MSRLVVGLAIVAYIYARNLGGVLISTTIALFSIYIFYQYETGHGRGRGSNCRRRQQQQEAFGGYDNSEYMTYYNAALAAGAGGATTTSASGDYSFLAYEDDDHEAAELLLVTTASGDMVYRATTPENPFGNTLLTDYQDAPNRPPAMPADSSAAQATINGSVQQMIATLNASNADSEKLFMDLGDNFRFDQSMRQFYPTANTQIPSDQDGFLEFCYGGMISCKQGNELACTRKTPRYNLY